jgi:F-type H+-transporting ATPase subunit gamma
MEDRERTQKRLENISTVEPILSALRMIALGSWQAARRHKTATQRYGERLLSMLSWLLPHLPGKRHATDGKRPNSAQIVVLVVGSERGLCGGFNTAVVEHAEQYLAELAVAEAQVELMALGTRARRLLQQPLAWAGKLPVTSLPPFRLAFDLTGRWLARYEACELDRVDLVYNAYHGAGGYQPDIAQVLPPPLPKESRSPENWPPPIIETDPLGLYTRIVQQWAATNFYRLLLESATAEHASRYRLMEVATQNAERLIEELTIAVQAERRQAITREMQELAAGAGLIDAP